MTDAVTPAAPVEPAVPVEPAPAPAAPATPAPAGAEPAAPAAPAPAAPLAANPEEPAAPVTQKWPDDWRQQLAGDDKKMLERLGRYASPNDIAKALTEAQDKIRSGLKPKERPGEKATAEETTAYRKDAGIPETVDEYVKAIELPDKRAIGEEDKPVVAAFAERALAMNIPPKDIAGLVDEYYAIQEEQANLQAEQDAEYKTSSLQSLREEWGGEFKANINAMRPYFEAVDAKLFDNLMGGRMADGRKVGDHPDMIRFFVAKAVSENPAVTVVPAGGNQAETIDTEIKALQTRMRDDRDAWFKDKPAQDRLQKLYDAQAKLASK